MARQQGGRSVSARAGCHGPTVGHARREPACLRFGSLCPPARCLGAGAQGEERVMPLPGVAQRTLGRLDLTSRSTERLDAVRGIGPHLLSPNMLEALDRLHRGGVGPASGRRALHVLLQSVGILSHGQQFGLVDAGRGQERPSVQAQPARTIGRTLVHHLGGHVEAEPDVGRPAGHPSGQVLAELDPAAVLEPEEDFGLPAFAVPRLVLLAELSVLGQWLALGPPDAAQSGVQRGVPARLAGFVAAVDQGHAGGELEGLIVERSEGVRCHALDAHAQSISRSVRPSRARRPAAMTRRSKSGSSPWAATFVTNWPRTLGSCAMVARS